MLKNYSRISFNHMPIIYDLPSIIYWGSVMEIKVLLCITLFIVITAKFSFCSALGHFYPCQAQGIKFNKKNKYCSLATFRICSISTYKNAYAKEMEMPSERKCSRAIPKISDESSDWYRFGRLMASFSREGKQEGNVKRDSTSISAPINSSCFT